MTLADVNVLLPAFRPDHPDHARCRAWLDGTRGSGEPYGVAPQVLSSVLRIVTHPGAFRRPEALRPALGFCGALLADPHAVAVNPGERHWGIFADLCARTGARGNLVPDAWFAALALEHACEWITLDRDFARFPGLRWREP